MRNGIRELDPKPTKPMAGEIVVDSTGRRYEVKDVGLKYLNVTNIGEHTKFLIKITDVFREAAMKERRG